MPLVGKQRSRTSYSITLPKAPVKALANHTQSTLLQSTVLRLDLLTLVRHICPSLCLRPHDPLVWQARMPLSLALLGTS